MDLESKIKQVTQELKRQEAEMRKRRVEQERLRTLSEQYEQLERQYTDWGFPASDQNLQEIATELALSNCWICGGLRSTEKWPWEGEGLAPEQLLKWDNTKTLRITQRPEGWGLGQEGNWNIMP